MALIGGRVLCVMTAVLFVAALDFELGAAQTDVKPAKILCPCRGYECNRGEECICVESLTPDPKTGQTCKCKCSAIRVQCPCPNYFCPYGQKCLCQERLVDPPIKDTVSTAKPAATCTCKCVF
ncbi:hypothetical protein MPTK1_5g10150 [Marchantia polymorpha subsp. ruderalis]|uniref:Uncharacterized protein n=1 Tax=Marchantia polymorpha subsp. ruderalis TaxID=1480154 RepID=A0AAF6BGU2_MARPO|nr:hypothetical protein Mp_5g10150 [Marchantia polymorpha subsp. ruderalis]